MLRDELREYLNPVYDLERLLGRVSYRTANPRDLVAFRSSLEMLPSIKTVLRDTSTASPAAFRAVPDFFSLRRPKAYIYWSDRDTDV